MDAIMVPHTHTGRGPEKGYKTWGKRQIKKRIWNFQLKLGSCRGENDLQDRLVWGSSPILLSLFKNQSLIHSHFLNI